MSSGGGQAVQQQLMVRIDEIMVTRVLPDLIESDVRRGDRSLLDAALGQLAQHVEVIKTPLAAALLARSEAKTQLLFGEWLRRQGRRRDARPVLQAAYEQLDALGVDHLAERAKLELAATGEHARKRTYDTQDDLTPQEAQVAGMAAQGARNTEIAHRLFISPATVEYHLSKVYRKLGIDSRAKLVRSMLLADSHEEHEAHALIG